MPKEAQPWESLTEAVRGRASKRSGETPHPQTHTHTHTHTHFLQTVQEKGEQEGRGFIVSCISAVTISPRLEAPEGRNQSLFLTILLGSSVHGILQARILE